MYEPAANTETITVAQPRPWRPDGSVLAQWGIIGITVLLVVLPLLPILYQALLDRPLYAEAPGFTLSNFGRLAVDSTFLTAIRNSIVYALGATAIGQVIGVAVALLAGRTNIIGKSVVTALILWPLLISDLVGAMGWSFMYGPGGYVTQWLAGFGIHLGNLNSLPGMMLVGGVSQAPLAYLYCIAAVRAMDPALEDAARVAGASPLKVIMTVALPLLWPAILASGFFNFIVHLESLSIPLIFGEPSGIVLFTTYIYVRSMQAVVQDYGLVAASCVVMIVLVLATILAQRRMLGDARRFVTIGGKASRPKPFDLGAWRWPVSLALLVLTVGTIGVPLIGVGLQAFAKFLTPLMPFSALATLNNFRDAFSQDLYVRSLINSLIVSAVAAVLGTALIFLIATVTTRSQHPLRRTLESAAMLPRAIPGMIAGIGFFYASVIFGPLSLLHGTLGILVVAFVMRYLPLAYGAVVPSMMQVSAELDRSARTAGASWLRTMFGVLLPIMKPALIAAFALLFLTFFKEYATAVFLFAPGTEVVGAVMVGLVRDAKSGILASLATVQVVITVVFLILLRWLAKVKLYD